MAQQIFHCQAPISSYSQIASAICILIMRWSSERRSPGHSLGKGRTQIMGPQLCLHPRGLKQRGLLITPQAHHSLLVFVAPLVSCGVVPEEQRFPFCAVLPPLPGGIPLLLFQHKFFLCRLVLISFIYCTGNVLPKPRNKQGSKRNHLKTDNVFCQLEPWSRHFSALLILPEEL